MTHRAGALNHPLWLASMSFNIGTKPQLDLDHKEYDALYISDIHFIPEAATYRQNNQGALLKLLKSLKEQRFKFQRVFIVGDGLENWFISSASALKNNPNSYNTLLESLEAISQERFYIIGNHCTTSINMKLPRPVEKYLKRRKWKILKEYRDKDVIVTHGHQAQYTMYKWRFFIPFAYLLYSILRLIPGSLPLYERFVLSVIDFDKTKSEPDHFRYHLKLIRQVKRCGQWLVSGHTHRPVNFKMIKSINAGDWLINHTFITQKNVDFKLWEYHEQTGVQLIVPNLKQPPTLI